MSFRLWWRRWARFAGDRPESTAYRSRGSARGAAGSGCGLGAGPDLADEDVFEPLDEVLTWDERPGQPAFTRPE
ncbi:hypothetical protein AB0C84_45505, partial [Actinomadura sp. NPDC048955]